MIHCDLCTKGWVRISTSASDWSFDACPVCKGLGHLSYAEVARMIKVNVTTLRGVMRMRHKTRAKTAAKILERVMKIIAPKQGELFR